MSILNIFCTLFWCLHCWRWTVKYRLGYCYCSLKVSRIAPLTIKVKLGQILVYCMENISNIFWTQFWALETSCRPFYNFSKMTIEEDLAILNNWHLPFLIVPYSFFKKNETLESWHNWLLSNLSRLLNSKGHGT